MDQLIWDIDALQSMASQIRLASEQLQDCRCELRTICAAGEELFINNDGASRRILEQAESIACRTERISEKCSELAGGLTRVVEMLTATEISLQKMAGELPVGTEESNPKLYRNDRIPVPEFGKDHRPWQIPGCVIPINTSNFAVVPTWLSQAADRAFRP